jgi:hypothetical protein
VTALHKRRGGPAQDRPKVSPPSSTGVSVARGADGHDPMARPTPADLLILADIAEILDDPGLASRWRWQARNAMRPASLRAEMEADSSTASALIADLSAQTGSLDKAYMLLGPDLTPAPAADGAEPVAMIEAPRDPRRWTR